MKLIALCGAAGAGKDTVADMLPARKLAFADTLYREVAEAFGVSVDHLQTRALKELTQLAYCFDRCQSSEFKTFALVRDLPGFGMVRVSPRQILQWWGDYRRAQDPDYFVKRTREELIIDGYSYDKHVITDVRFPNEAAMVRQLDGQIWQIQRPDYEAGGTGHASDTAGDEFGPDLVVTNGGSLEDLRATVLAAWEGV